jgi:hypothetical protein
MMISIDWALGLALASRAYLTHHKLPTNKCNSRVPQVGGKNGGKKERKEKMDIQVLIKGAQMA